MNQRSARRYRTLPGAASRLAIGLVALLAGASRPATAQQVVDSAFRPSIGNPAYGLGTGPRVIIDGAHENFHTKATRYRPFAAVLEADGYRVSDVDQPFSAESLGQSSILVIANAGLPANRPWSLPARSAFRPDEIDAVIRWIEGGGALFLIVDHLPAGGAAADLGRRLGVEFTNGYTVDPRGTGPDIFLRADATLLDHPITRGRNPAERVDSVATFTGQAFQLTTPAEILLRMGPASYTWLPARASTGAGFDSLTAKVFTGGWPHAVAKRVGAGRVVIVGEAGGFTAQRSGPNRQPMGLNHPRARGNQQFLLNIVHWLSGLLD